MVPKILQGSKKQWHLRCSIKYVFDRECYGAAKTVLASVACQCFFAITLATLVVMPIAPTYAQTIELNLPKASTALSRPETKRAEALFESAVALRKAGQLDAALIDAEAGLLVSPRDLPLRFLRGIILTQSKRTDAAVTAFEELTQEFPELAEPHNNLAVLYASKGEFNKARAALERALNIFPDYVVARENLGDVYIGMAREAYQSGINAAGRLPKKDQQASEVLTLKLKATTDLMKLLVK